MLWLTDSVVPAQEHFSSNLIRRKIITEIDKLPNIIQNRQELILLFTPEGEFHEIPLLFNQYMFKKNKRKTLYLGSNVSFEVIKQVCTQKKITHLFCYIITNFTKNILDNYIISLAKEFKEKEIVIGGPLTLQILIKPSNVRLLQSFKEQLDFVEMK